ncbi:hypothetical protein MRX96_007146 [Rhipicephalus microplus]
MFFFFGDGFVPVEFRYLHGGHLSSARNANCASPACVGRVPAATLHIRWGRTHTAGGGTRLRPNEQQPRTLLTLSRQTRCHSQETVTGARRRPPHPRLDDHVTATLSRLPLQRASSDGVVVVWRRDGTSQGTRERKGVSVSTGLSTGGTSGTLPASGDQTTRGNRSGLLTLRGLFQDLEAYRRRLSTTSTSNEASSSRGGAPTAPPLMPLAFTRGEWRASHFPALILNLVLSELRLAISGEGGKREGLE